MHGVYKVAGMRKNEGQLCCLLVVHFSARLRFILNNLIEKKAKKMNKIRKWLIIGILPLIIIGGILFFLGKDLQKVSLEKFEITGIEKITTDSFTLNGNLYLKNPSKLSIPIKTIEYTVILKEKQQTLSSGTLAGFTLEKNMITKAPFSEQIKLLPTSTLAIELITKDKVFITIKGKIIVDLPEINKYEIPFETEIDMKEVLKEQINKKSQQENNQPKTNPETTQPEKLLSNKLI